MRYGFRRRVVGDLERKWVSCSSQGRLTFDTALLRQPASFRAKVMYTNWFTLNWITALTGAYFGRWRGAYLRL